VSNDNEFTYCMWNDVFTKNDLLYNMFTSVKFGQVQSYTLVYTNIFLIINYSTWKNCQMCLQKTLIWKIHIIKLDSMWFWFWQYFRIEIVSVKWFAIYINIVKVHLIKFQK
jgi:hypothetical protein